MITKDMNLLGVLKNVSRGCGSFAGKRHGLYRVSRFTIRDDRTGRAGARDRYRSAYVQAE